jgi:hypothetical protein
MTVESAAERRIGFDGRVEGGEKCLKVRRHQGDGLMGLYDLLGRSQSVREHEFGHADMRIGGCLVEQLPGAKIATDVEAAFPGRFGVHGWFRKSDCRSLRADRMYTTRIPD